ncbi:MAG: YbjQ family protein [Alphaproteobacteria bacterium]|nr:YbjQ family protein [Alphaproteobacteria bacterium]
MLLTTTDSIEGRRITAYLGIVSADVVMGANVFRDLLAAVRDVVGGRAGSYESVCADTKQVALGADAVVGIDLDYEIIGGDKRTMLMVSANGTAIKLD